MGRRFGTALVLVAAVIPLVARAGLGHRAHGHCGRCARPFFSCLCPDPICGGCQLPPPRCCCPPPPVQLVPQTTTVMREERFTTCQPVTRTVMRREAQIVYRDVPMQIVERVPVVQTRLVPMQVTTMVPAPVCPPTGPLFPGSTMITPQPPGFGTSPTIISPSVPTQSFSPPVLSPRTSPLPSAPTLVPPSGAVPEPYSPAALAPLQPLAENTISSPNEIASLDSQSSDGWSKVPRRTSNDAQIHLQSYQQAVSMPMGGTTRPLPTAAAVWRAQSTFR